MSRDGGQTWNMAGNTRVPESTITGLPNQTKVHVWAIAQNPQVESAAGPEYPIYSTKGAPAHPDGLKLQLAPDRVRSQWGEVLGAGEYVLYRRVRSQSEFRQVYRGLARAFQDMAPGVIPAIDEPVMRQALQGTCGPIRSTSTWLRRSMAMERVPARPSSTRTLRLG